MRLLTLVSVAGLITACGGGDRAQTSPEESTELATRSAQTVREISDASGATGDERPRNADTQDAVEPPEGTTAPDATTEVEPCELSDGMCPNACEHGESGPDEVCVTDSDCDCGHCCGFGTCQPFDVMGCESFSEYAGCLCHGACHSLNEK